MTDQITTFNYTNYSSGIEVLCQQMSSHTRAAVKVENKQGERVSFDQVGGTQLTEKTGRAVDVPQSFIDLRRRWCSNKTYWGREFVDEYDKLDILNDPTNAYSQAFSYAGARRIDQVVVAAALGTAYAGKEGTTPVALPNAQKIAAGGTGFTLAKLKEAAAKIKQAEAWMPGDAIHLFWTAAQEAAFIDTLQVSSSDYTNDKVLIEGELKRFYGVNFHRAEDFVVKDEQDNETLVKILPKVSTTRSCLMWVTSGMKLNIRRDQHGTVDWLAEKRTWQVYAGIDIGAVRMQEKKVVQIDVVES